MGAAAPKTQAKGKIYLTGPKTIHAKVGDTLSFLPLNADAADNLLGAYANLGSDTGISEYVAVPGSGVLQFYQAAQVFSSHYRFTGAGTYTFAIVPPAYSAMKPDASCGVLTVIVTR